MNFFANRRKFLGALTASVAGLTMAGLAQEEGLRPRRNRRGAEDYVLPPELAEFRRLSVVLGRVTDRSVTVSVLSQAAGEGYIEHGMAPGEYGTKSAVMKFAANEPVEAGLSGLQANTQYHYRLQFRAAGGGEFAAVRAGEFHTQRAAGASFTFAVQGDSHPERPQMSEPNLYARTLLNAAADRPDFYVCMGDDFSVEPVQEVTAAAIAERYVLQRPFLGLVGRSAPVFLLNGNHEQASLFNFNQPDERHAVAVLAQQARNKFYPTPGPDGFYSGDTAALAGIGLPKDYCAWTWGDALFVILDNYWHSPVQVDTGFHDRDHGGGGHGGGGQGGGGQGGGGGGGRKGGGGPGGPGGPNGRGGGGAGGGPDGGGGLRRDGWGVTLGDAQYQWFKRTLEQSRARYKFVFAHHVLGTGRGGIENCELFEWGGYDRRGEWGFAAHRPGWEMPVHPLMVKHGVTIFFQGHDHLYCRQERDGIIYQEVPMPADHGYATYNAERYLSGVKRPNSGHLRIQVAPDAAEVEYVRSFRPQDETAQGKTGQIADRYTVKPRGQHA